MKRNHLTAAIASLMISASMAAVPVSVNATGSNYGNDALITADSYTTNYLQAEVSDGTAVNSGNTLVSNNAMIMKKILKLDDTASIPKCSFTFTPSVPDKLEDSTNGIYKKATDTTLAVYAGVNPDAIVWKEISVDSENNCFQNNNTTGNGTDSANGTATVNYAAQSVTIDNSAANQLTAGTDDVLLSSTATDDGYYYAVKALQIDFSACQFSEPGVYRYYIQEDTASGNGITNDTGVTDADSRTWRTIDVYVEDATYTKNETTVKALKIAGYVMYVGKLEDAPSDTNSGTAVTSNALLEDGISDNIFGDDSVYYGSGNGAEAANAVKSEGYINTVTTHKLTFSKTVDGNQGSKDKYFKFTLQLTGSIDDADEFKISTESNYDKAPAGNSATVYTAADMKSGNDVTVINGSQVKADGGYAFYLQDGQKITVTGIPEGVGYVLTEYNEDYVPSAENTGDTINGTESGTAVSLDKTNADQADITANTASIKDTALTQDTANDFTNTRRGVIPTGILLSVAAPASVGILAVGGIAYLLLKNKRRDEEE